jgi:hypothetical protein
MSNISSKTSSKTTFYLIHVMFCSMATLLLENSKLSYMIRNIAKI